ncbi:DUF4398 domain-containing protein [Halioxenophilus aromaticivorans]|uniref:DUF4398 domain-containing protein n=1 Tax=Halioxenophilus aromaticivorans TaxID=1306992 RepID=A0AAV3U7G0_9ALTE
MKISKFAATAGLISSAILFTGCASQPDYDVGLQSEVETRIDAAIENGAEEYAPVALHDARKKLNTAERYIKNGDDEKAQIWLEKARVDAELAAAQASSEKAKFAAEQIDKDIQSLRGHL